MKSQLFAYAGNGNIQWFSKRILSDVGADISQAEDKECASQAHVLPSYGRSTLTEDNTGGMLP